MSVLVDSFDKSNQNQGYGISNYNSSQTAAGQAILGQGYKLSSVKFALAQAGPPPGNIVARVYSTTGSYGSAVPSGSAIASSSVIAASSISSNPTNYPYNLYEFSYTNGPILANDVNYAIVVEISSGSYSSTQYVYLGAENSGSVPLTGGEVSNNNGSWDNGASVAAAIYYIYGDLLPVAYFTTSQINVKPDENITFTDTSTNTPTSWSWDFGDSSTASTDQNPIHSYSAAGTYIVTLTATNAAGSNSATMDITVEDKPVFTGISSLTGVSKITFS